MTLNWSLDPPLLQRTHTCMYLEDPNLLRLGSMATLNLVAVLKPFSICHFVCVIITCTCILLVLHVHSRYLLQYIIPKCIIHAFTCTLVCICLVHVNVCVSLVPMPWSDIRPIIVHRYHPVLCIYLHDPVRTCINQCV